MTYVNRYLHLVVASAALAISSVQADNCNNKNACCPTPSTATVCTPITTDFVIVGLGTAGATAARFLSDPNSDGDYVNSVVVLEAGQNYNSDPEVLDPNLFDSLNLAVNPKYSSTYSALVPGVNVGFAGFLYTEGRMWGGGSGHNGLIAVRGSADVYDQWAVASGNTQWTYNNLLPLMKGLEHYTPNGSIIDASQRGTNGALYISQESYSTVSTSSLVNQFAITAGAPLGPDYNVQSASVVTSSNQSFVTPPVGSPNSKRSFSANAFLPTPNSNTGIPVLSDEGIGLNGRKLRVVSHATASRILFDTTGTTPVAIGVEYILDGNREQVFQVFARKKVILCAGAIENVGILQRSGVGPSSVLDPLGIPVILDNPRVGANLQNHYGTSAIIDVDDTPGPFGLVEAFIDCSTATGIGANFSQGVRRNQVLFVTSPAFFGSISVLLALGIDLTTPTVYTSFGPTIIRPKSRGFAQIVDTDPLTNVKVNFNFYSDGGINDAGSDAQNIVAALRIIEQTATAFGATMIYPRPAQYTAGDAALFAAAQNLPFITYHAAGTCSMGLAIDDPEYPGVVDGNLNVFGVDNLMVADCSVETFVETGNTAYGAYVIGAKAAQILGATVPTA